MPDDITERIAQDIQEGCRGRGRDDISLPLALLFAKTIVMDDENPGRYVSLHPDSVQKVIQTAIEMICGMYQPQLETIKMQVALSETRIDSKQQALRNAQSHQFKSNKLITDIVSTKDEGKGWYFSSMINHFPDSRSNSAFSVLRYRSIRTSRDEIAREVEPSDRKGDKNCTRKRVRTFISHCIFG